MPLENDGFVCTRCDGIVDFAPQAVRVFFYQEKFVMTPVTPVLGYLLAGDGAVHCAITYLILLILIYVIFVPIKPSNFIKQTS